MLGPTTPVPMELHARRRAAGNSRRVEGNVNALVDLGRLGRRELPLRKAA